MFILDQFMGVKYIDKMRLKKKKGTSNDSNGEYKGLTIKQMVVHVTAIIYLFYK